MAHCAGKATCKPTGIVEEANVVHGFPVTALKRSPGGQVVGSGSGDTGVGVATGARIFMPTLPPLLEGRRDGNFQLVFPPPSLQPVVQEIVDPVLLEPETERYETVTAPSG